MEAARRVTTGSPAFESVPEHVGESPISALTPLAHEGQGAGWTSTLVHLSANHLASMRMEGVQQMRYVDWKK